MSRPALFLFSSLAMMLGLALAQADDSASAALDFDAVLAEQLGADAYGMRQYVMAFLKAGPNQEGSAEEIQAVQAGHMAHIRAMAEDGKLALAGPFMDGGEFRGIFLFAVDSIEEAEALTAADPAVQAGRLVMELKPWYGSAALMQVNTIHSRIAAQNP